MVMPQQMERLSRMEMLNQLLLTVMLRKMNLVMRLKQQMYQMVVTDIQ